MSAEEKYREALRDLPPPGSGCHPALMAAANLGAMAGRSEDEIVADLRAALKPGERRVPDKELRDTARKALAEKGEGASQRMELGWDSEIPSEKELRVFDPRFVSVAGLPENHDPPEKQVCDYLNAVFEADEKPCICLKAYQPEGTGKWVPGGRGVMPLRRDELCNRILDSDLEHVIGTVNEAAGAWVRINPMADAEGKDTSVSAYRHALVECDNMPVDRQYALIRELQLPCAAIVHSGGKSIHALVKVEAATVREYRDRVDYLHAVCNANGMKIDHANVNPSRYSRLPGVMRNGHQQTLLAVNVGKSSWQEWRDYIEAANDELPDFETLDLSQPPPELSPEIIEGVLRRRHKLLLAAASKAGKTFALMQLAIAVATGGEWFGWRCAQGRVLYVNFELDDASCKRRFYEFGTSIPAGMLDIWNLRGRALPLDKLVPKLVRRAKDRGYMLLIIDPIYKVLTGDENAAAEMAAFCNGFDVLARSLDCAVVYAHHHSKGEQGQKRAQDRASGSGVFARDPDALLDMIELHVSDAQRKALAELLAWPKIVKAMDEASGIGWQNLLPADVRGDRKKIIAHMRGGFSGIVEEACRESEAQAELATGWRIEGILREFPPFKPRRVWYVYPRHVADDGILASSVADGEDPDESTRKAQAEVAREKSEVLANEMMLAYSDMAEEGQPVRVELLAERIGSTEKTVRRLIQKSPLVVTRGVVTKRKEK